MSLTDISINGHLVFPPSERAVFRDFTLYCKVFKQLDILLYIENDYKDQCYFYLKEVGCFDFVDDIVEIPESGSIVLSDDRPCDVLARRFWAGNLNRLIGEICRKEMS